MYSRAYEMDRNSKCLREMYALLTAFLNQSPSQEVNTNDKSSSKKQNSFTKNYYNIRIEDGVQINFSTKDMKLNGKHIDELVIGGN